MSEVIDTQSKLSSQILSDIVVHMKYAKYLPEKKRRETWEEIVTRNMEMHIRKFPQLEDEIREKYQFVYDKKVLPSMRSMQFAGKPIEINPARIFNCAFTAIDDIATFREIMFLLLSGVGVGYSVQKHHVDKLPEIRKPIKSKRKRYLLNDSIEGWSDGVNALIKAYFKGGSYPVFDFRDIRPKGSRLITSGGKAPGPQPLKECLLKIEGLLDNKNDGDKLTPLETHDLVCYLADAVLAGGIRRAALISLFSADDIEMLSCKTGSWWELNPQRARANNSAVLLRHRISEDFFMDLWKRIELSGSGEPGIFFTNNKEIGANPCNEIALNSNQFCNLVTINVANLESQDDYFERVKAAAYIATLQASYTDFHYLRERWKKMTDKEALIGVSMTGIAGSKVLEYDMAQAAKLVIDVNSELAPRIGINPAARLTTSKPDGSTSLVLGTSSGVHAWFWHWYLRTIRVNKNESLYSYLAVYHPELIEDEYFSPNTTAIISLPQKAPKGATVRSETPIQLLERVKHVYDNWIKQGHRKGDNTNNVSVTVSIKEDEWVEVGKWMWENRYSYNGISVLPYDGGTYVQAPFQEITEERYNELVSSLHAVDLTKVIELEDMTDLQGELACAGDACAIV